MLLIRFTVSNIVNKCQLLLLRQIIIIRTSHSFPIKLHDDFLDDEKQGGVNCEFLHGESNSYNLTFAFAETLVERGWRCIKGGQSIRASIVYEISFIRLCCDDRISSANIFLLFFTHNVVTYIRIV